VVDGRASTWLEQLEAILRDVRDSVRNCIPCPLCGKRLDVKLRFFGGYIEAQCVDCGLYVSYRVDVHKPHVSIPSEVIFVESKFREELAEQVTRILSGGERRKLVPFDTDESYS